MTGKMVAPPKLKSPTAAATRFLKRMPAVRIKPLPKLRTMPKSVSKYL